MPILPQLKVYKPGDPIRASDLDDTNATVGTLARYYADNLKERGGPSSRRPAIASAFFANVSNSGPNGESDFTDARYWLDRIDVDAAVDLTSEAIEFADDPYVVSATIPGTVLGISLFEAPAKGAMGNGTHVCPVGTRVLVLGLVRPTNSGVIDFVFWYSPPGILVVNLTQTGGSNGTQTTAATWTYTAKVRNADASSGATLGTGLAPLKPREHGSRTAATIGEGYYDGAGTFILKEAWEPPGTVGCG